MTHDDFIDEYLDQVEGDAELKAEPVPFNHYKHQAANAASMEEHNSAEEGNSKKPSSLCEVCGVDTFEIDEYYMVQFDIWNTVVPRHLQDDLLCVGCLEGFLGRQLISEDFIEAPVNYTKDKSERLLNRMGTWFRIFDGPFASEEEFSAAVTELGNRIDGLVKREGPKVYGQS